MDTDKLLKLADGLENYVKDEWWDYSQWFDRLFPEKACGTAGCAAGWSVPLMNDPRLTYKLHGEANSCDRTYSICLDGKRYNGPEDIMARYYDIPYDHAQNIFIEEHTYHRTLMSNVTRQDVVDVIRKYVSKFQNNPNVCYSSENYPEFPFSS